MSISSGLLQTTAKFFHGQSWHLKQLLFTFTDLQRSSSWFPVKLFVEVNFSNSGLADKGGYSWERGIYQGILLSILIESTMPSYVSRHFGLRGKINIAFVGLCDSCLIDKRNKRDSLEGSNRAIGNSLNIVRIIVKWGSKRRVFLQE